MDKQVITFQRFYENTNNANIEKLNELIDEGYRLEKVTMDYRSNLHMTQILDKLNLTVSTVNDHCKVEL